MPLDLPPDAIDLLVNQQRRFHQLSSSSLNHQRPILSHRKALCPFVAQPNLAGVRTGRDDKLTLELPIRAAIDQVNTGIEVSINDALVGRQVALPLGRVVAQEKVGSAGQRVQAFNRGSGIGPVEGETNHGFWIEERIDSLFSPPLLCPPAPLLRDWGRQRENYLFRAEEQAAAKAVNMEFDCRIGLALIGDKAQRKPRQGGLGQSWLRHHLGLASRVVNISWSNERLGGKICQAGVRVSGLDD